MPTEMPCSFCGKSKPDVRRIIAGPKALICDECIRLSSDLIAQMEPGWLDDQITHLQVLKEKLDAARPAGVSTPPTTAPSVRGDRPTERHSIRTVPNLFWR